MLLPHFFLIVDIHLLGSEEQDLERELDALSPRVQQLASHNELAENLGTLGHLLVSDCLSPSWHLRASAEGLVQRSHC